MFGSYHNEQIRKEFDEMLQNGSSVEENEFLGMTNALINEVAMDDRYSTNSKLKIYDLMGQLCNCAAGDRHRYARKIRKLL
jgi:hypothetical protein